MADVPADVLEDFRPRYAGGGRALGDSAADLEGHAAGDEPECCSSSASESAEDAVLAALRSVALRRGRNGRLGLGDYAVVRQGQKGGFGRVAVAVVEGVSANFALKTVRCARVSRRLRGAALPAHVWAWRCVAARAACAAPSRRALQGGQPAQPRTRPHRGSSASESRR
jgi:hypothetical protein